MSLPKCLKHIKRKIRKKMQGKMEKNNNLTKKDAPKCLCLNVSKIQKASVTRTLKTALKYASVVANYRGIGTDHRITHLQHSRQVAF